MGELEVCVPLSVPLSFFHGGGGGGGSVRVCAPCVLARECVCVSVRAELPEADFASPQQLGCRSFSSSGFHVAKWLQRLLTNN